VWCKQPPRLTLRARRTGPIDRCSNVESDLDDAIVLRIDADLASAISAEASVDDIRPAPSVRGTDLATAGAVVSVLLGVGADLSTVIVSRAYLTTFAGELLRRVRDRQSDSRGELKIQLSSPLGSMNVDVRASDASTLAEALRRLADVSDAISPPNLPKQNDR
jgi:hypothetical protein